MSISTSQEGDAHSHNADLILVAGYEPMTPNVWSCACEEMIHLDRDWQDSSQYSGLPISFARSLGRSPQPEHREIQAAACQRARDGPSGAVVDQSTHVLIR